MHGLVTSCLVASVFTSRDNFSLFSFLFSLFSFSGNRALRKPHSQWVLGSLLAGRTCYMRTAGLTFAFCSLKTKFNRLARLNAAVPANVAGCVGIAAGEFGIPAICDRRAVAVTPINAPSANGTGAIVGDADSAGETIAPLVRNQVVTVTRRVGVA